MSFQNKVVLVTGGSSGIGAATAIAFAAKGARVAIVGRNEKKLAITAEKCEQNGSKPLVIAGELTKDDDLRRIIKETINHFGRLDVLVNNAGVSDQKSILAPDLMETYDKVVSTNLRAVVYLTNLAAPHLVESKGNIVNVSSVAGQAVILKTGSSYAALKAGLDHFTRSVALELADKVNVSSVAGQAVILKTGSSYAASKAGLDHFTRSVALELADKGVRVNTVSPGPVRTDIMESNGITVDQRNAMLAAFVNKIPLRRVAEPEEIADVIIFLASDKARSITGSTYVSDNGLMMNGCIET